MNLSLYTERFLVAEEELRYGGYPQLARALRRRWHRYPLTEIPAVVADAERCLATHAPGIQRRPFTPIGPAIQDTFPAATRTRVVFVAGVRPTAQAGG